MHWVVYVVGALLALEVVQDIIHYMRIQRRPDRDALRLAEAKHQDRTYTTGG